MGPIQKYRQVRADRGPLRRGPDVEGFIDHLDTTLGRTETRRLLRDYPDIERALSRNRIQRAWAGVQDALDAGDLGDDDMETLVALAEEHDIPTPD